MPARHPRKNHLVITGRIARPGLEPAWHEGPLEADYYILLKHDREVKSFHPQEVKVKLPTGGRYTPDVLVHFHQRDGAPHRPSELTEVKPQHILDAKEEEFAPKFAAATEHATSRGWIFLVKSAKDMNQELLKNVRLLRGFLKHPCHETHHELVRKALKAHGAPMSVDALIKACEKHADADSLAAPIWRGVINRDFYMDLDQPVTMTSLISLQKGVP